MQIKKINESISKVFYLELFVSLLIVGCIIYVYNCGLVSEMVIALVIAALFIFVLPFAFLDTERIRLHKIKKSLLANHKNILPVLTEYCCVENFCAENSVSKELLYNDFLGEFIRVGNGCNYLKFTIDDISVETSQISMSIPGIKGSPQSIFFGQIAILTTQESFPGRLLIIRTKTCDNTDNGFSIKYLFDQQYNRIIYSMLMPDKRAGWKWTEVLKNSAISVSNNFDQIWRVYSTNPKATKQFLGEGTILHNYLLYTSRMAFVLYDNNRIFFGGKYDFNLTDSTSADISEEGKVAIYAFFKEAIPAVTKNALHFTSLE